MSRALSWMIALSPVFVTSTNAEGRAKAYSWSPRFDDRPLWGDYFGGDRRLPACIRRGAERWDTRAGVLG